MDTSSTGDFVKEIRAYFEAKKEPEVQGEYLDLGEISECTPEQLLDSGSLLPRENPVYIAFLKIVRALQEKAIIHAKLGINELLRQYLLGVRTSPGSCSSETFLEHLYLIVLFFTQENYPYQQYFYDYLIKCYHAVCAFLLAEPKEEEIEGFVKHIAGIGKIAAQKQMDTSSIQHLLRNIEVFAGKQKLKDIASKAKDSRHNLET